MSGDHSHVNASHPKLLVIALALTSMFLAAELVGGIVFGSLALLSDAAHMFTDVVALAIALVAIRIGERAADDRRTFGYRRFEILAAAFNAILLFGVAIYVLVEGIQRFLAPEPVQSTGMFVVAVLGLLVNLVSMRILSGGRDKSLNVKGAYLEVWADMMGSLGVIAGAVLIRVTGWQWIDPVIAIAISFWILPRTWILLRDTTQILVEGAPRGVVLADMRRAIVALPGVAGLHDLHVWISGADEPSCSMHIELMTGADGDAVRRAVRAWLKENGGIHHVTIQTEREACGDRDELHP
jgi:cobalt-zinc-cadmium efflux system protein